MSTADIKYRVYDKQLKVVCDVTMIDFENKLVYYYLSDEDMDPAERDFDEVELLQYTGFYDIRGNELYEGDLVEFRDPYTDGIPRVAEIFYDTAIAAWSVSFWKHGVKQFDSLDRVGNGLFMKKLGSIYDEEVERKYKVTLTPSKEVIVLAKNDKEALEKINKRIKEDDSFWRIDSVEDKPVFKCVEILEKD